MIMCVLVYTSLELKLRNCKDIFICICDINTGCDSSIDSPFLGQSA